MSTILLALLQIIVSSGILYGYYHFFLRNKQFHQYNRFYLLGSFVVSLLIPFLQIPVYFTDAAATNDKLFRTLLVLSGSGLELPGVVVGSGNKSSVPFNWNLVWYSLYAIIAFIFLARIFLSVRKVRALVKQNPVEKLDQINFVNTSEPGTPFSFFHWLFWDKNIELSSSKGEQIFRHEVYHIQQKHSWDVIFMEIFSTLLWINPFFHLMKKEVRAIHEFLADKFAMNETGKWAYAELLLMQVLETRQSLVNPFFHNQIKRRIAMITNPQKTSHRYLRKLLVLPVAALVLTLFAFKYHHDEPAEKPTEQAITLEMNLDDQAAWPTDNNGQQPASALTRTVEKAMLQISEVQIMPSDTTPKTSREKMEIREVRSDSIIFRGRGSRSLDSVLVVINGDVRLGHASNLLDTISPSRIQSITILKDASANSKYGPLAKNGVIEIELKPSESELVTLQGYEVSNKPTVIEERKDLKEVTVMGYPTSKKPAVAGERTDVKEVTVMGYQATNKPVEERKPLKEVTVVGYGTKRVQGQPAVKDLNEVVVVGYGDELKENDPIFTSVEVEPSFPGGQKEWNKYLERNLNGNVAVSNNAPAGTYTVRVQFIVDKDGTIKNLVALTQHGYGMEEEVIQVLRKGPKWNPALQAGKKVNAYRIQPVTFMVDRSKKITLNEKGNSISPVSKTQPASTNQKSLFQLPAFDAVAAGGKK